MKLAFIMPNETQRDEIGRLRECIIELRRDQIDHLEHLLRSWGVFGRMDGIEMTNRAIKRVLNDRP